MTARLLALLIALSVLAPVAAQFGPGGPPPELKYVKKETREESRRATLAQYLPSGLDFGPWWIIGPFANAGLGELDIPEPPELDGFDPEAVYEGKHGREARWTETDFRDNAQMNLKIFPVIDGADSLNNDAAVYLYREITVDEDCTLPVRMGSDDGLKVWVNGRVVVHADVHRGWDPDSHSVNLDLVAGVNKVLVKVVNHLGGFDYSFSYENPLDPLLDAMLEYQLDLDFPRSPEDEYYRILTIPVPDHVVLEVGGLDVLPDDGRPAVATRRGDVWLVNDAYADPPFGVTFTHFASGLHEPLGLRALEDGIYLVQRPELTRLADLDGDDAADLYETVCADWGVSGNYHEFAFGPKVDRNGDFWVTLNVGFCGSLGKSIVPWRGWALKIDRQTGEMQPICGGLRSPNGIGMNADGEMFFTDNQGDWVGTNKLSHLKVGSFHGHPATNAWYDHPDGPGPNPGTPAAGPDGPIPMHEAAVRMPTLQLPAVWFPYKKMGQSASDILLDETGGKFGPFENQLFVGDQTLSCLFRVTLEKVDGEYQGACYPFRSGFDCGINRMEFGADGSMFVGMTNRGWGSIGRKPYGLQRLLWTGKVPFEVLDTNALADGFLLTFTKPVDPQTASDINAYRMIRYTYQYFEPYGSPEIDTAEVPVTGAEVSADGLSVRLRLAEMTPGYVHELHMPGVRTGEGDPLLHDVLYYTLNRVPSESAIR